MSKGEYQINSPKVVWRRSGENVIILSIATGEYFALNPTASFIWDQLQKGHSSAAQLSQLMIEKFDIGPTESLKDIQKLLEDLKKSDLVIRG